MSAVLAGRLAAARAMLAQLGARFLLMLGGEVLQSAFHFGLNLALVRVLAPAEYGVFAIIFLVGGISLTFVRALAGVPASILIPQARGLRAVRAYAVTFGSGAAALSLALAAGATGVLLAFVDAATAWSAGAFVGLWSLRSVLRTLLFARRRPVIAGAGDVAFTATGTALLALLILRDRGDLLPGSLAVLAAAHAVGIGACLGALGEPVRICLRRHVLRRYRGLWPSLAWSVAGVAIANVQAQGQTLIVALLAGPAAYAPIAATLMLFAPLRLPASVVVNLMQPEMAATLSEGRIDRLNQLMALATGLLALGCLAYGAVLATLLPVIESRLFAGRFADAPLGLIAGLVWVTVTITLLYAAPKTLLETLRAFRELATVALASAAVGIALVGAVLLYASPAWSLVGVAASEAVILAYCLRAIRLRAATDRGSGRSAAPGPCGTMHPTTRPEPA